MNIKSIETEEDLIKAFKKLEGVFQAEEGSKEAEEAKELVALIEKYEAEHYAISKK